MYDAANSFQGGGNHGQQGDTDRQAGQRSGGEILAGWHDGDYFQNSNR